MYLYVDWVVLHVWIWYASTHPPLTPVGMKVLGIFIAVLFLWSTVGLAWPALMGIVALGMSGYCTVNEAIALSLGSSVV